MVVGWWSIPVKVMQKDDWGMGQCLCNYWSWMKLGVECHWISMRQLSYLLEHLGAWRRYMQISYQFGWLNELHLHFRRVNEPHLLVADCHICLCSLARATLKNQKLGHSMRRHEILKEQHDMSESPHGEVCGVTCHNQFKSGSTNYWDMLGRWTWRSQSVRTMHCVQQGSVSSRGVM